MMKIDIDKMSVDKISIRSSDNVTDALKALNKASTQFLLVCDNQKLYGTITDGDIRRALINGNDFSTPAHVIANQNPIVGYPHYSKAKSIAIMQQYSIHHLPIVDDENQVIQVVSLDHLLKVEKIDNPVLIMAGGLGTRLRPYTNNTPKPMLDINGKPLLARVIENLKKQGFHKFYLSVNYKAEIIKDYFKDGTDFNIDITYLEETERKGTAGSLSLITDRLDLPMIVMNGDLITKSNFVELLKFHDQRNAKATMCVRNYNVAIPFGVVESDGDNYVSLHEKPSYQYFVSAGIYVVSPSALSLVAKDGIYDMPQLFDDCRAADDKTCVFPIHDYWLDIGQPQDLERARNEYATIFGE